MKKNEIMYILLSSLVVFTKNNKMSGKKKQFKSFDSHGFSTCMTGNVTSGDMTGNVTSGDTTCLSCGIKFFKHWSRGGSEGNCDDCYMAKREQVRIEYEKSLQLSPQQISCKTCGGNFSYSSTSDPTQFNCNTCYGVITESALSVASPMVSATCSTASAACSMSAAEQYLASLIRKCLNCEGKYTDSNSRGVSYKICDNCYLLNTKRIERDDLPPLYYVAVNMPKEPPRSRWTKKSPPQKKAPPYHTLSPFF
jgi:hypothetical protein